MRFSRLLVAAALLGLAGCARPVGDLGRAQPGFTHDRLLPAVGHMRASLAGQPVSSFDETDAEREMHNRTWRFLVSPSAGSASFDFTAEMKRTGIGPDAGSTIPADRYYAWLQGTEFASSRVRYRRLEADIEADLATLPTAFASICAVLQVDHERGAAFTALGDEDVKLGADTGARREENRRAIADFSGALSYRGRSYSYALDHLLIETPHEEGRAVDSSLGLLSDFVGWAEAGQYCGAPESRRVAGENELRPRILLSPREQAPSSS